MISFQTAYDLATAHKEIEKAETLLKEVQGALSRSGVPEIRDAFGRQHGGLQLGVPSGQNCHTIYHVEWSLCVPVLTAHIGQMRAKLAALNELARTELDAARAQQEQP